MQNSDRTNQHTKCIVPPPLEDDELLAYIDGEAGPSVQAHLAQCGFCSGRLKAIEMFENGLQHAMYRAGCPPADALADYAMRLLMTSEHAQIENHIEGCPRCRGEVETLRAAFALDEPPVAAPPNEPAWERVKGFLHGLRDPLVRVLLPQPLAAAVQLKGRGSHAQIYMNGPVSVMLSAETIGDRLRVNGSIVDPDGEGRWNGGAVELTGQAGQRYVARIDDDEMFTLDVAQADTYSASLFSGDGYILRLENVELK
jgi:hypothetical protein